MKVAEVSPWEGGHRRASQKGFKYQMIMAQLWSVKDTNIHTVLLKTKTEEI